MNFSYYMPTKIVCGRNCIREHAGELSALGTHALIVTGRSSAKNGALADVLAALEANGQGGTVFDRVMPNPTVACVREGIALLKSAGADFVIGLGGGSPMDAAKAIATLAVQPRDDGAIFDGGYDRALPMAHIPTTAGTGSEVTPYSILTNDEKQTKTSISSPAMFPRVAFLDGRYTDELPVSITVNTALDAFSHAAEGLLSCAATPLSDSLACESLRILYPILKRCSSALTEGDRDALLYASALAGMTIAQSGTTAVHGMGYCLTYFYGVDHGRANGLLLGETLLLCERKQIPALKKIVDSCGEGAAEIAQTLSRLIGRREEIPRERLEEFADRSMGNKNIKKSQYRPNREEVAAIFLRSFGYEA